MWNILGTQWWSAEQVAMGNVHGVRDFMAMLNGERFPVLNLSCSSLHMKFCVWIKYIYIYL